MMKGSTLLIVIVNIGLLSCKQGGKSMLQTVDAETVNSIREYAYVDPTGKRLIIHNSFPKGSSYIDPNGKQYFKVIFWTRIINETDHPLSLKIDFPEHLYEVPGSLGNYYKILVPPDTMTTDRESLYDYGMVGLKSFLDTNIHKPSSLRRTINPGASSAFYFILLSLSTKETPAGTLRTALSLKGLDLFYKISRYASKKGLPLIDEKEILCGSINLENLVLQK